MWINARRSMFACRGSGLQLLIKLPRYVLTALNFEYLSFIETQNRAKVAVE